MTEKHIEKELIYKRMVHTIDRIERALTELRIELNEMRNNNAENI